MRTFTHPITLHAASRDETEVVDALVDTGATCTAIPSPVLERLGIVRYRLVRLRLADGRLEEWALGRVMVELNGETDEIHRVFADPDGPAVIGAVTLEVFLPSVDPVQQRLVPVEGYSL